MESGLSDPCFISMFNSTGLNLNRALKELWSIYPGNYCNGLVFHLGNLF